jgi:phospholipase D1/2
MGRRFKQRFHVDEGERIEPGYSVPPHGSCRVQVVRSVSDWSHGVLTEHSIQNACESPPTHHPGVDLTMTQIAN